MIGSRRSARSGRLGGIVAAATLALAGAAHAVTLSAQVQTHVGLKTTVLTAQKRSTQIDAFAKVLDPGPLAQLQSDLLAAEASAGSSRAEAERARALHASGGSVSAKDAEAAVAQAGNDAAHLALLRQRLGLEWGPGIARMTNAARQALIDQLSRGDAALVHVDTPSNEGQDGARSVDIDVGSGSMHGQVLGAARAAEPRLQSSGLIVKVSGPKSVLLSVGLTNSAHINQTSALTGVILPRAAVIRFEGSDWAYVQTSAGVYERRRIDNPAPQGDAGLFVAQGFAPGEAVVSRGAAEVFSIEQAQATRAH